MTLRLTRRFALCCLSLPCPAATMSRKRRSSAATFRPLRYGYLPPINLERCSAL